MKLKKILSGFLAGAIAVTSMVVTSVTAGAATTKTVVIDSLEGVTATGYKYPVLVDKDNYGAFELTNATAEAAGSTSVTASIVYLWDNDGYCSGQMGSSCSSGWDQEAYTGPNATPAGTTAYTVPFDVTVQTQVADDGGTYLKFEEYSGTGVYAVYKLVYSNGYEVDLSDYAQVMAVYFNKDNGGIFKITSVPAAAGASKVKCNLTMLSDGYWGFGSVGTSAGGTAWNQKSYKSSQPTIDADMTVSVGTPFDVELDTVVAADGSTALEFQEYSNAAMIINSITYTIDVYAVAVSSSITNGTVTASKNSTFAGDTVTLTVEPSAGYKLKTLTVAKAAGNVDLTPAVSASTLEYTFEMPAEDVTVSAVFEPGAPTSITVSPATSNVVVGDEVQLTAAVEPAGAVSTVTWSSSDESLATVSSDGKVTTLAAGDVTITATSTVDASVKGTATVKISATAIDCTAITLSKTAVELTVGGTETITATKTPSNATGTVTWTTSNATIATVVNGKITAVGVGTATITAACGSATAACTVTVKAKTNPFDQSNMDAKPGQQYTLKTDDAPDGTHSEVGAMMITKADVEKYAGYKVTITATNGASTKKWVRTVTNAYDDITFDGMTSSSDADHYYILVTITHVPAGWTVSYSFEPLTTLG